MRPLIEIVYVDPCATHRESVRDVLPQSRGFLVTEACNRREFEALLSEHRGDIVVSNLNVPDFGDESLVDTVRSHDLSLPLLLLAAPDEESLAIRALECGATDYLLKTGQYLRHLPFKIASMYEKHTLLKERNRAERILQEYAERLQVTEEIDHMVDESLRQYAKRLVILHEIDQAILEARSPRDIADAALRHLFRLIPCQRASVTTLDLEQQEIVILSAHGAGQAALGAGVRLPIDASYAIEELAQGHVRIVKDLSKLPAPTPLDRILMAEHIVSYLTIPLIAQGKLIGDFNVSGYSPDMFTAEHLEIANEVASQVALALQQARLFEQVQQYAAELEQRTEQEIRQLTLAIEQTAAIIVITDLAGNIVFVNAAFEKSAGYSKTEVIGKNPRVLKTSFLPREIYNDLWKTISSGNVWHGEFCNQRKDGKIFWEDAVITPIKDTDGKIVNYIAIKEDITPRKAVEDELRTAKEHAETANRLKSMFLANMSHEIRTPMNAILGFARVLRDQETQPQKLEYLDTILRSGQQLLNLLNDILDFSKIEANTLDIHRERFAVRDVFEDLRKQFEPKAAKKQLSFTIHLDEPIPPFVYGDRQRVAQILAQVMDNALKFTHVGAITLICRYHEGTATFRIADTGIGIPEEKLPSIFSPFEQLEDPTIRQHGGAGLGLTIAKRLTELLGGTIGVESRVGVGSTLTITLPLSCIVEESADEASGEQMVQQWLAGMRGNTALEHVFFEGIKTLPIKIRQLEDAVNEQQHEQLAFLTHTLKGVAGNLGMSDIYTIAAEIDADTQQPDYPMESVRQHISELRKLVEKIPEKYWRGQQFDTQEIIRYAPQFSILVAEDNELNQMLIRELLRGMFLDCDIAENGQVVLEKLSHTHYDLLLLDMQMPIMDGVETITRIRQDARFDQLIVIAITGHNNPRKFLDLGCNAYIAKPIHKEVFYRTLSQSLFHNSAQKKSGRIQANDPRYHRLSEVIRALQDNCEIFDPARVKSLAETLNALLPDELGASLHTQLLYAADTYDDQAIKPIIKTLEALMAPENVYEGENTYR